MFTGFGIVGVMGPALFAFGMAVALDRDLGLLRLKRALPMPPMAYLLGKMTMAMLFSGLVMLMMIAAALAKGLDVALPRLAAVMAIAVLGTMPFCALGLFIGSRVSGRTAPAWVNLAYLPMTYLSGLFFPMPESIRAIGAGVAGLSSESAGAAGGRRARDPSGGVARGGAGRRHRAVRGPGGPPPRKDGVSRAA